MCPPCLLHAFRDAQPSCVRACTPADEASHDELDEVIVDDDISAEQPRHAKKRRADNEECADRVLGNVIGQRELHAPAGASDICSLASASTLARRRAQILLDAKRLPGGLLCYGV